MVSLNLSLGSAGPHPLTREVAAKLHSGRHPRITTYLLAPLDEATAIDSTATTISTLKHQSLNFRFSKALLLLLLLLLMCCCLGSRGRRRGHVLIAVMRAKQGEGLLAYLNVVALLR